MRVRFLDEPVSKGGLFSETVKEFAMFSAVKMQTEAIKHILPHRGAASKGPGTLRQQAPSTRRRGWPSASAASALPRPGPAARPRPGPAARPQRSSCKQVVPPAHGRESFAFLRSDAPGPHSGNCLTQHLYRSGQCPSAPYVTGFLGRRTASQYDGPCSASPRAPPHSYPRYCSFSTTCAELGRVVNDS